VEAEQYIPFDINDVNLDYVLLDRPGEGVDTMEFSLVAVRRTRSTTTRASSARPARTRCSVDVDAFALQKRFRGQLRRRARSGHRPGEHRGLGDQREHPPRGNTIFWRDISIGETSSPTPFSGSFTFPASRPKR